jgi:hypothetical protein
MENNLTRVIINQTQLLFRNVEVTLDYVEEDRLDKPGTWAWPLREQIYHMLRSLDQWYINPENYPGPELVWTPAVPPGTRETKPPTKTELTAFFESTKRKINTFLTNLSDESWNEYPENSQYTRLDLILGQNRHLMYHLGVIHGCLRTESGGKSPEYMGLKYLGPVVKS